MVATEAETGTPGISSLWRGIGRIPAHQALVLFGGFAATAVGLVAVAFDILRGVAAETCGLALFLAGAMALVGHAIWRWEVREGILVTAIAGLFLVVLGGEPIGTPTGLLVLGGASWAFLSTR